MLRIHNTPLTIPTTSANRPPNPRPRGKNRQKFGSGWVWLGFATQTQALRGTRGGLVGLVSGLGGSVSGNFAAICWGGVDTWKNLHQNFYAKPLSPQSVPPLGLKSPLAHRQVPLPTLVAKFAQKSVPDGI